MTTLTRNHPYLHVHAGSDGSLSVNELSSPLAWAVLRQERQERQLLKSRPKESLAAVATVRSAATTVLAAVTEAMVRLVLPGATRMMTIAPLHATNHEAMPEEMTMDPAVKLHDATTTVRLPAEPREGANEVVKRRRKKAAALPHPRHRTSVPPPKTNVALAR